ncbi:response regulator [Flaviaesturariibacter amylovorans]|uniref:Response regulatory domain-containing protein n=1 Tax=Flaviaesturariibacter amylovorans TaxID=1084520 RepID=A0ABP8GPM4_9BACT
MAGTKIYYVEDDRDDAEIVAEAFAGHGYEIHVFNNPVELFHQLHLDEFLPTLIILDINLPLMNGLEALQLLKAEPKFSRIPVSLLSTSEPGVGFDGKDLYFLKPTQYHDYEKIVTRLLEHSKRAASAVSQVRRVPDDLKDHPNIMRLKAKLKEDLARLRDTKDSRS